MLSHIYSQFLDLDLDIMRDLALTVAACDGVLARIGCRGILDEEDLRAVFHFGFHAII